MSYLIDTWLWVEYFQGSQLAAPYREAIDARETATSIVTLAELSDRDHREGHEGTQQRAAFIEANSRLLAVSPPAALRAGATKWAQRRTGHPMGIADALIYETAQEAGLVVVTGDEGFQGLEGVAFVPRPKGR